MTVRYLVGDVRDAVRSLPDNSVDLVFTSSPFLAVRSYLPANHPEKAKEIGTEDTPAAFIDTLLDVVEAVTPKLTEHGSLAWELSDSYASSGGSGGDYNEDGMRAGQPGFDGTGRRKRTSGGANQDHGDGPDPGIGGHHYGGDGWPLSKSLCMIPESFRWALVYGRNPFNGRETPPWRARNVMRWSKSNPSVGSLSDKVRPATSEIIVACKSAKRYFDLDAVRVEPDPANVRESELKRTNIPGRTDQVMNPLDENGKRIIANAAGAPPLDWFNAHVDGLRSYFASIGNSAPVALNAVRWLADRGVLDLGDHLLLNTNGYPGAHYAVFSEKFAEIFIKSMCPQRVCRTCGEPSRRIVEKTPEYAAHMEASAGRHLPPVGERLNRIYEEPELRRRDAEYVTTGWSDCGHDDFRPGVTLDPFGGSGTVGAVCIGNGRDAILVDIDERNVELARDRCGMFLEVENYVP